jgi:hypothetical protein
VKRVYVTHCSAKKDNSLKNTDKKVTPDRLYTSKQVQRFIQRCKDNEVDWAIFSDKYGVIFPWAKVEWYDKHPSKVSSREFQRLVDNFVQQLSDYDEVWFYYNPGRFHPLYKELLDKARSRSLEVVPFTRLSQIR